MKKADILKKFENERTKCRRCSYSRRNCVYTTYNTKHKIRQVHHCVCVEGVDMVQKSGRVLDTRVSTGSGSSTGAPGANGASAYEIAVQNGFVGTERQWSASLSVQQVATENSYTEMIWNGSELYKVEKWTNATKSSLISRKTLTFVSGKLTTVYAEHILDGTTQTTALTWSGDILTSVDKLKTVI